MPLISGIKDFESLTKLSGKFMLPLFALACLIQPPPWVLSRRSWPLDRFIPYLELPRSPFWHVASILLLLFIYALLSGAVLYVFDLALAACGYGLACLFRFPSGFAKIYFLLTATPFVSFGLLALVKFSGYPDPVPSFNVFLELALFTYGITRLQAPEAE